MSEIEQPDELIAEEDADVAESELDSDDDTPDEEESDAVLPPDAAA